MSLSFITGWNHQLGYILGFIGWSLPTNFSEKIVYQLIIIILISNINYSSKELESIVVIEMAEKVPDPHQ